MKIKFRFKSVPTILVAFMSLLSGSQPALAAAVTGKYFDRAIIVVFENTNYADAVNQPFLGSLAKQGATFTNFIAEAHPSQANYIGLITGTLGGVSGDGVYDLDLMSAADLLEKHGLSWKVYAEGYPGGCFTGAKSGQYVRKHNPFISINNIHSDVARCNAHIVNADEFDRDLAANSLPNYVFYVPDLKNDGHDTGVAYADKWYGQKFGPVLANAAQMKNTVLISTFDESGWSLQNLIYTTISGPDVKPGEYKDSVNHFSLLKLIEDNWSLGTLHAQDDTAPAIPLIWK